jgi:hypothetical protein
MPGTQRRLDPASRRKEGMTGAGQLRWLDPLKNPASLAV